MTKTAIPDLWDDKVAASLSEPGLLLYRSNLLGSDLRITNFGGGNTSAKVRMTDPLTRKEETVLWVKGSGGDLGSMKLDGFSTLYLDKLYALKGLYRGIAHEDEMVDYLPHCTFNLNPRAASIDTPLHALIQWQIETSVQGSLNLLDLTSPIRTFSESNACSNFFPAKLVVLQ